MESPKVFKSQSEQSVVDSTITITKSSPNSNYSYTDAAFEHDDAYSHVINQEEAQVQVNTDLIVDHKQPLIDSTISENLSSSMETSLDWNVLVQKLHLRGLVKQLGQQSELVFFSDKIIEIRCENRALATNAMAVAGLEKALLAYFKNAPKNLKIHVGQVGDTPAKVQAQVRQELLNNAQDIIAQDATVRALVQAFDGMILPNSIKAN